MIEFGRIWVVSRCHTWCEIYAEMSYIPLLDGYVVVNSLSQVIFIFPLFKQKNKNYLG